VPSADRTSITLTLGKYAAKPLTLQGSRLIDAVGKPVASFTTPL
jgi:hypothetical protein